VGFILVVLVQLVCAWAGLGISLLWFHRLLVHLVQAFGRVDSTSARDARSGRLYSLADALPRGRLSRLGLAESSAFWA